ncbi:FGGY family carbohydrate kinase [Microbacterium sp. SA39]|uniref:FGGY family carbohydrate kinase n=1 Tax=Microbacterium sp. SA39 TaxID=1263625 RepID=UPI00061E7598|nr:FGGY family carbohydrate kinase [Microbacterium sp. SA39]KJQ52881.1 Glycerol kinase [Microbacterium sp. SA39]
MPEAVVRGPVTIAVDQGTSATKGLIVDSAGVVVMRVSEPLEQTHPRPGWVEQDPVAMRESVDAVVRRLLAGYEGTVAGIGFSTQRESAIAWDPRSGAPLSPVLGWQDRRTADHAVALASHAARVREVSGLPLDPMFSALKFAWILDEIDPNRTRAEAGRIALGTVDSWLLWNAVGEHRIEIGNASRTQLLDLSTGEWSAELLELFRIPRACLPRIVASDAAARLTPYAGVPLRGVLGDSHAALYGHGVRTPGDVKVTYGTGSSVMGLTEAIVEGPGLVGTIAWGTEAGGIARAFEGNILSTGATLVWLARLLGTTLHELDGLARTVSDSGGVDIVPAFAGLAAPWWDERATGIVSGLQLGSDRARVARAAFESIALQIEDVLSAAEREGGRQFARVLADGGPSRNPWLMQLQADLSGRTVARHDGADLSALGAARLAALAAGVAEEPTEAASHSEFVPDPAADAAPRRARWSAAVARARGILPT